MSTFNKKVPLGLGCLGLLGGLLMTNLSSTVSAGAITNAAAVKPAFGECTGPKYSDGCGSENTNPCSDTSGCDSTTEEP